MLTRAVDTTYADDAGDPSIKLHQADHDTIHDRLWTPPQRYPRRPANRNMIWGGQAGHTFTNSATGTFNLDDTSDFALGTRSMRMQTAGTNAQTYIQKIGLPAVDLTNRTIELWLKLDNYTAGCDFRILYGSGGSFANYLSWVITDGDTNKIYLPGSGTWVQYIAPLSKAATTGTPTLTALTDFRLQLFDASTSMTVHLGGIATVPTTNALWPNGVVSFTFDDGYADHYTEGKYLDKYGYAGTEYPIIDVLGTTGYMTLAQLKALQNDSGWEIGLHAYTSTNHNISGGFKSLTSGERVKEVLQSREWLMGNGFPNPGSFAYPQGEFDAATITDLAPWVDSARTTKGQRNETFPPSNRMVLHQLAMDTGVSAATVTARMDLAKANKEWLILLIHQIRTSPTNGTTPTIFQTVVDYAASQGLAQRTVGEVLAAYAGA